MSTSRPTIRSAVPLLVLGALLSGCGADDVSTSDAPTTSTASSTATETATPSETATPTETETPSESAPPELIAYAGGEAIGYEVRSPEDVAGMQGAPTSFKRFIAREVARLAAGSTCDAPTEIIVEFLRTDGFATGGVNACGGYQALWVQVDGQWQEVDGTQEMEGCAVLEQYRVPSDLVDGRCYDYDTQQQRDYRQD